MGPRRFLPQRLDDQRGGAERVLVGRKPHDGRQSEFLRQRFEGFACLIWRHCLERLWPDPSPGESFYPAVQVRARFDIPNTGMPRFVMSTDLVRQWRRVEGPAVRGLSGTHPAVA